MNTALHSFESFGTVSAQFLESGNYGASNPWSLTRNYPGDINGRARWTTGYSRGINYLLKRDMQTPGFENDNSPMWLEKAT